MAPGDDFFNLLATIEAARQGFLIDLLKYLKSGKAGMTSFVRVFSLIFVDRHLPGPQIKFINKKLMLKAQG